MAHFVNYKKRDIALPPGCKDLMDVLESSRQQTKSQAANSGSPPPDIKEDSFASYGLAQIGLYVSMLHRPRREFSLLRITSQEFQASAWLHRFRSRPIAAIALLIEDAERKQALHAFFEQRKISPMSDSKSPAFGAGAAASVLLYPLPPDASDIVGLMIELLLIGYDMSAEAGLGYYSYED